MNETIKRYGRVVIIHGARFRQKDRDNLRMLGESFRAAGFSIVLPTYGYMPALVIGMFQWLDRRIADTMSGFIRDGDILLGHSNGATLVYLITQQRHVRGTILINAALDMSKSPNASFTHVYFNEGDNITRLSAFVPFHPWGMMGAEGFTGDDPRVTNIDCSNPPEGLPKLDGHSDVFAPGKLQPWANFMAKLCLQAVQHLRELHHHVR